MAKQLFQWLIFDPSVGGIFIRGENATSRLSPPEPGSVTTVSKTKSFATDFTVANSWQILSANPAQILATGKIKSIPAIILKCKIDFHLRTTFCETKSIILILSL